MYWKLKAYTNTFIIYELGVIIVTIFNTYIVY